jgi:hypothetical protein
MNFYFSYVSAMLNIIRVEINYISLNLKIKLERRENFSFLSFLSSKLLQIEKNSDKLLM